MRRDVIQKSASRVSQDLLNCEIDVLVQSIIESHNDDKKSRQTPLPANIFQKYIIATHDYNYSEIEICKIFGIQKLLDSNFWDLIINKPSHQILNDLKLNINFSIKQIPKVIELIKQDYVYEIKNHTENLPNELQDFEVLTVIVVEDNMHFSTPQRLAQVLESISLFYDVFSIIGKESSNDLSVIACDSGSDKSFDFLGLSKIIEKTKELIIAIWDRKVLYRHKEMHETLELISNSLPLLAQIEDLKNSGAIEREQAEILKRKTINGVVGFLEAGATIPELNNESSHSPRELMKPEQKLLTSPPEIRSDSNVKENHHEKKSKLSEEEIDQLEMLLKKAKGKNKE